MQKKTLIIIPSRIGSTRLAKKALVRIGDSTMIEHVAKRVIASKLNNIYVATDDEAISIVLKEHGINSIMTDPDCPTGTDRIYAAWQSLPNKNDFEYIINVQGDMPFIEPSIISKVAECLWQSSCDIVTPIVKVGLEYAEGDSNVTVVATSDNKALYFSRSLIPHSGNEFLYHVGVYGYKAKSLEKFVKLPVSYLEKTERLEQLRALENGMSIEICEVDTVPMSIDTVDDLQKALAYYSSVENLDEK